LSNIRIWLIFCHLNCWFYILLFLWFLFFVILFRRLSPSRYIIFICLLLSHIFLFLCLILASLINIILKIFIIDSIKPSFSLQYNLRKYMIRNRWWYFIIWFPSSWWTLFFITPSILIINWLFFNYFICILLFFYLIINLWDLLFFFNFISYLLLEQKNILIRFLIRPIFLLQFILIFTISTYYVLLNLTVW
jgi:hypothetical protein